MSQNQCQNKLTDDLITFTRYIPTIKVTLSLSGHSLYIKLIIPKYIFSIITLSKNISSPAGDVTQNFNVLCKQLR